MVDVVCAEDQVITYDAVNVDHCPGRGVFNAGFFLLLNSGTLTNPDYRIVDGKLTENLGNGTARFTGRVINYVTNNAAFDVVIDFSDRREEAVDGAPKENEECVGDLDNSDWHYYLSTSGKLVGINGFQGAVLNVGRMGEPFQVGTGANLKNETTLGAGGWFTLDLESQPNDPARAITVTGRGDLNVGLINRTQTRDCLTLCEGESTKLLATSAADGLTYAWSTGATTAMIEVAPSATTTYTVTVTDENGCSDETSVEVTVTETPMLTINKTDATCEEANGSASVDAAGG